MYIVHILHILVLSFLRADEALEEKGKKTASNHQ